MAKLNIKKKSVLFVLRIYREWITHILCRATRVRIENWMNENWIAPTFTCRKHIEWLSRNGKNTFNSIRIGASEQWERASERERKRIKNVNKCSALNFWTGILAFVIFVGKIECDWARACAYTWKYTDSFFFVYWVKENQQLWWIKCANSANVILRCISVMMMMTMTTMMTTTTHKNYLMSFISPFQLLNCAFNFIMSVICNTHIFLDHFWV